MKSVLIGGAPVWKAESYGLFGRLSSLQPRRLMNTPVAVGCECLLVGTESATRFDELHPGTTSVPLAAASGLLDRPARWSVFMM
jgi:hypothetical protein